MRKMVYGFCGIVGNLKISADQTCLNRTAADAVEKAGTGRTEEQDHEDDEDMQYVLSKWQSL